MFTNNLYELIEIIVVVKRAKCIVCKHVPPDGIYSFRGYIAQYLLYLFHHDVIISYCAQL